MMDVSTKMKALGVCTMDLTPFGLQPTEEYQLPIRQQIKFVRTKGGKEVIVGRCLIFFKILPYEVIPVYQEELEEKKIERH